MVDIHCEIFPSRKYSRSFVEIYQKIRKYRNVYKIRNIQRKIFYEKFEVQNISAFDFQLGRIVTFVVSSSVLPFRFVPFGFIFMP